ncbi:MAG: HNH endonuclease [Anaerolineales bacterium]|nr:HNH endonuclease [Anaerolineales bacterium]
MLKWRWEQGRLDYFNFNSLRKIALGLTQLSGIPIGQNAALMRSTLVGIVGLPFLPTNYTVWRNYARVFRCAMLAGAINGRLVTTDLCSKLAEDDEQAWGVDEYFSFLFPRFYYPFPAFAEYSQFGTQIFPLSALIKYLVSDIRKGGEGRISLNHIFDCLIGNQCTGLEPIEYYASLTNSGYRPVNDEIRQVREMITFFAQSNFLKWLDGHLYLDVDISDHDSLEKLIVLAKPLVRPRAAGRDEELIALGLVDQRLVLPSIASRVLTSDLTFTEGKRRRTTHLRVERSPVLRKFFIQNNPIPILCDMCKSDTNIRYPWTQNMFEIHHLLPLSSTLAFDQGQTSLRDLVPLCPNCHKSVHLYYKHWLAQRSNIDFSTVEESHIAYNEAKRGIVLT